MPLLSINQECQHTQTIHVLLTMSISTSSPLARHGMSIWSWHLFSGRPQSSRRDVAITTFEYLCSLPQSVMSTINQPYSQVLSAEFFDELLAALEQSMWAELELRWSVLICSMTEHQPALLPHFCKSGTIIWNSWLTYLHTHLYRAYEVQIINAELWPGSYTDSPGH